LWTTINDQYLYPDFNGQDWDAVYTEVRQQVEAGLSNQDFYLAMAEMVDRLGDDHSVYLSPEEVAAEDAEYAGNLNYVGIGILITAVPENGSGVILVVFPGSPAEQAGLQPRDNILPWTVRPSWTKTLPEGYCARSRKVACSHCSWDSRRLSCPAAVVTSPNGCALVVSSWRLSPARHHDGLAMPCKP
jgi:hypothetical protein